MASCRWYFEPSDAEINAIASDLTEFESVLLAKLIHIIRVGLHLANVDAETIGNETPAAQSCQKFITSAQSTWLQSDKLFPLRCTAPSLSLIRELIPDTDTSRISIFRIMIQRVFGVGYEDDIRELSKKFRDWDSLLASDFQGIKDIVVEKIKEGKETLPRPAYGNMNIKRYHIPKMVDKLWQFSGDVDGFRKGGSTPSFELIHRELGDAGIPTIPEGHGLLTWLIPSDLVEWQICKAPKIETLIAHLLMKDGPKGPKKAMTTVVGDIIKSKLETKGEAFNEIGDDAIRDCLTKIWKLLSKPPADTLLVDLMKDSESAQGRSFSVVDLEHNLCKVTRYHDRVKLKASREKSAKSPEGESSKGEAGNAAKNNQSSSKGVNKQTK